MQVKAFVSTIYDITQERNTPPAIERGHDVTLRAYFHLFIGSTLAGSAIVAALVLGYDTLGPILIASANGFVASIYATYVVTKAVLTNVK
jgi:hypothetical protein